MRLMQIYQCLCDPTRLRILNLLGGGPLCVCHLQEVLGESQVKVSKHLAYLRARGMVKVRRRANWMIYSLPAKLSRELHANLACLQDCARDDALIKRDMARLRTLRSAFSFGGSDCCPPEVARAGRSRLASRR